MPSLRLFLPKHIAFMAYRKHFSYTSVGMVVFAIILILFRGLNFGVDFRGGVAIEAHSNGEEIT
jgi:preprotein translocase subunit SecF